MVAAASENGTIFIISLVKLKREDKKTDSIKKHEDIKNI